MQLLFLNYVIAAKNVSMQEKQINTYGRRAIHNLNRINAYANGSGREGWKKYRISTSEFTWKIGKFRKVGESAATEYQITYPLLLW